MATNRVFPRLTMIATQDTIGIGVYTVAEAAFYARVKTQTLSRWIFGDKRGDSVIQPQICQEVNDDRAVSFLDFVQALAIRAIRTQYPAISLQKIRKAVDLCRDDMGVEYPFAMDHRTYVYDEREIVLELDGKLIQVSGKQSRNLMIGPIAELYMTRIEFGSDGQASKYRAWGDLGNAIIMNPKRRFGEPVVESCGYTAQVLAEASIVEGGLESAARAYGVDVKDVTVACDYFDHLRSAA